jgi:hypothetical protein
MFVSLYYVEAEQEDELSTFSGWIIIQTRILASVLSDLVSLKHFL